MGPRASLGRWGFLSIAMESRGLWSEAQREARPSYRRKTNNGERCSKSQDQGSRVGGLSTVAGCLRRLRRESWGPTDESLGRRHGRGRI